MQSQIAEQYLGVMLIHSSSLCQMYRSIYEEVVSVDMTYGATVPELSGGLFLGIQFPRWV